MNFETDLVPELDFTPENKGRRHDYNGSDLHGFTKQTAQTALKLWEEINIRRVDAGQSITSTDYKYFSDQVGKLGSNVIHLAAGWNNSSDPLLKQYSGIIVLSQSVDPILNAINKLKKEYRDVNFDEDELIQDGVIRSLRLLSKLDNKDEVSLALASRLSRDVFLVGMRFAKEETQEYSSVPDEELELGKFVTANLDSVIDYYQEAEKASLRDVINEALTTIPESHARIIRRRYFKEGPQPATLEVLAIEEEVSKERIRAIEDKATRLLRNPYRSEKFVDFWEPRGIPVEFQNDEAREQEDIRLPWNGVINAIHLRDEARAKYIVARLKANMISKVSYWNLGESFIKMLLDPNYPTASSEALINNMRKYMRNPEAVLRDLAALEFGEGYGFDQIRKMEKRAHITRREPIVIPAK